MVLILNLDKKKTNNNMPLQNIVPAAKTTVDVVSMAAITTTLMGYLPPAAAFMSILWLSVQMYDRLRHGPVRLREKLPAKIRKMRGKKT